MQAKMHDKTENQQVINIYNLDVDQGKPLVGDTIDSNNNVPIPIENEEKGSKFKLFGYRLSQIKWFNVVFLTVMHILAIYGYYHCIISQIKALTVTFIYVISIASGIGSQRIPNFQSYQ